MKERNIKANINSLFKSFINNKELISRRKYSILFPLLSLILIITLLTVPSYLSYKFMGTNTLMKSFPEIEKPMETLLTSSLDCTVKNAKLECSEDADALNVVVGETIKYTIIANQDSIATNTEVTYSTPRDTDNLIILLNKYIRIRYIQRDHVNEEIVKYEILGNYTLLEGYNFKEIATKLANDPTLISSETEKFIVNTYKSTLSTKLVVSITDSIVSFLLLLAVTCLVLKGSHLFKRKKGLKFIECFKISLTSAFPSIILSLLVSLMFGMSSIPFIFGLLFVGRIIFIYFKYIFTNTIFKEIYAETKEERFNV